MQKLYYSIAEVAEMLHVEPSTLRYWEKEFPQLTPRRNAGRTRFYTHENVATAKQIAFLRYDEGLSIEAVKQRLRSKGDIVSRNQEIVEKLKALRADLVKLKNSI